MPPETASARAAVQAMDPAIALGPHPRDAQRLLFWWTLRRAAFGLFFVGLIVGILVAELRHEHAEVYVDASSTQDVLSGVLSTFGLVFVAIIIRVVVRTVCLAHAYPVADLHRYDLGDGGVGHRFEKEYDRFCVARAVRELRWTEGVLVEAESHLEPHHAALYVRFDRALRNLNIAAVSAFIVTVAIFGFTIEV